MSLKNQCKNNIVDLIKNLPPKLKEEVIGESLDSIKEKIMKQMRRDADIVIKDVVDKIITAHSTGIDWKRPEYTKNIDNELYGMYVDIAGRFVDKFWMYEAEKQYKLYISAEEQSDEESDGESYFF